MGRKLIFGLFALVLVVSLLMTTGQALAQKKEPLKQFVGILIYRTGPFAAGGSGFGSGWEDFMTLRNMQGGVNGVMYEFEECETAYNTARGVECYERLKDKIIYVQPFSTGITYALIDRAKGLEADFASKYPAVERFVREMIDTLVRMGI